MKHQRFTPTPGDSWRFVSQGKGPHLLLLHGLGASSFTWRHNLDFLSQRFTVTAPDLPGHGRSPAPLDGDYRVDTLAQGVVEFMDSRGIDRAALVGNSLGGGLATLIARRWPERVSALILLAPAVALTRLPWAFFPLRLPGLGLALAAGLGPWFIAWFLRLVYYDKALVTPAAAAGYGAPYRELRPRLALRRYARQLKPLPPGQVEDLLRQVRQPVRLIWGEQDRILPVKQAHWLAARLPQARLHLLPKVGHAPQDEAPDAVHQIIIDFLSQ